MNEEMLEFAKSWQFLTPHEEGMLSVAILGKSTLLNKIEKWYIYTGETPEKLWWLFWKFRFNYPELWRN